MKKKALKKLDSLLAEAEKLRQDLNNDVLDKLFCDAKFLAFRTQILNFIENVFGGSVYYHKQYLDTSVYYSDFNLTLLIELLKEIKIDIEEGWLNGFKSQISVELFTNFLNMAEHLLDEGYKDSAAVIIGSVLEENLRQLALRDDILITRKDPKSDKEMPLDAASMNTLLAIREVYSMSYHKDITAWLDLKNKAAHGKYSEYDLNAVKSVLSAVRDFSDEFIW